MSKPSSYKFYIHKNTSNYYEEKMINKSSGIEEKVDNLNSGLSRFDEIVIKELAHNPIFNDVMKTKTYYGPERQYEIIDERDQVCTYYSPSENLEKCTKRE